MVFQLNDDDLVRGCLSDVQDLILVVIYKSKDLVHVQGLNVQKLPKVHQGLHSVYFEN